jgi:RNA polymerase sigma-70 factor (ECF subfamily)
VKTRLHRSRAMLRRELETRAGPPIRETYAFMGVRCDRSVARVLERLQISPAERFFGGRPQPGR